MEFTVKKSGLEHNLQLMQGVVETKITMPILANILIQAEDEQVRLKATDLEVGIETTMPCNLKSPGSTTINVKKLYEFVKSLPDDEIHFARESDTRINITSKNVVFKIAEMPSVEFPRLPDFPVDGNLRLKGLLFCDLLKKISFNLVVDDKKQHRGSLFVMTPDSIMLVATDGHRMTYIKKEQESFDLPVDLPEYRLLLNRKAIQTILRIQPSEEIEMSLGENHIFFRIGSTIVSSRLLELKFPKYDKVIPRGNDKFLKIGVDSFLISLKRACLVTNDRAHPAQITMSGHQVELRSIGAEIGSEHREPLQAEYDGEDLEIRFNAQYLIDFLQVVGCEHIRMELKDADRAVLIRPMGEMSYEYLYVLMPMRI